MSRSTSVIPGFGLTLGYTLVYLSLLVLIPLGALFLKTTELSWAQFIGIVSAPRVLAALKLSFGTAFAAAVLNGVIGTLLAWVLVRYRFPGRKIIEAMIDLPFALPTAVAGIATGVTLAIARVAGETAPILVTAGFATSINWNPFDNWMTALPVYIYRQLVAPTSPTAADPSTARAWAAALLLVTIVMLLNLAARFIAKAFAPKKGR